uniref:Merozoite surface antigen-1 n=1 Tax=Babesia bovis TaxID=5865 RepID=R4X5P6_BABBO|nr:merozoite surface antigen-1 [Babesia bovis]
MATFALFISALCCVSAIASSSEDLAQESAQISTPTNVRIINPPYDAPKGLLFDDMTKFYGALESFDKNRLYGLISANFHVADMSTQQVDNTFTYLYKVKDMIKNNHMISPEQFKETLASKFSGKSDEEKFNAIFDSVISMFNNIHHMYEYLKSLKWEAQLTEEDRKKAEDYFKQHVQKTETNVDVNSMVAFLKFFFHQESYFYKLAISYDDFVTAKKLARVNTFVTPDSLTVPPEELVASIERQTPQQETSAQGETTGQPDTAGQPSSPGSPKEPAGEQSQQENSGSLPAAPNTPSADQPSKPEGNLNGQQGSPKPTGSSFTFGGLTVATLCYFVLSAF